MNRILAAVLLGMELATAAVWNAVDDPRCQSEPNRRVLEPSDKESPMPPPQLRVYEPPKETAAPTTAPTDPICPGYVDYFQIIDAVTGDPVLRLYDGIEVIMSTLPEKYTIEAVVGTEDLDYVKFFMDGSRTVTDWHAPFSINGQNGGVHNTFNKLEVAGTYEIAAKGRKAGQEEPDDMICGISITLKYGNPYVCQDGIITHFSLWDVEKEAIVPGYEVLYDNQMLYLSELPLKLTVIAHANNFLRDAVRFGLTNWNSTAVYNNYNTEWNSPFALAGLNNGKPKDSWIMNVRGLYNIRAKGKDRVGSWEPEDRMCAIDLHVNYDNPYVCEGLVQNFALWDIDKDAAVPGYEVLKTVEFLYLNTLPENIGLLAVGNGRETAVKFRKKLQGKTSWANGMTEWNKPYSVAGKNNGVVRLEKSLLKDGEMEWMAYGRYKDGKWEDWEFGDECSIKLIVDYGNGGSCEGLVSQFNLVSTLTGEALFPLHDNQVIDLSDPNIPGGALTVEAVGNGAENGVKIDLGRGNTRSRWNAPYYYTDYDGDGNLRKEEWLSIEGTYTFKAWGRHVDNTWEDPNDPNDYCQIKVRVDYGNNTGICDTLVTGFSLFNAETDEVIEEHLYGNETLVLNELPPELTIVPHTQYEEAVRWYLNGNQKATRWNAPYPYSENNGDMVATRELKTKGIWTFSALGRNDKGQFEDINDACSIDLNVIYRDPSHEFCDNLVADFSLVSIKTGEVVEDYENLRDGMLIDLTNIVDKLPVTVVANAADQTESAKFYFSKDDGEMKQYGTRWSPPYAFKGVDSDGSYNIFPEIHMSGKYKIGAIGRDSMGQWETLDEMCTVEFEVTYGTDKTECPGMVSSFTLYDAATNTPVQGYERMTGEATFDLAVLPTFLTLVANTVDGVHTGVRFYKNWRPGQRDYEAPYAMAGDENGSLKAETSLSKDGSLFVQAGGRGLDERTWEGEDDRCGLTIKIVDPTKEGGGGTPAVKVSKEVIKLLDTDDEECSPALVQPEVEGNYMFEKAPVEVVNVITNQTVMFRLKNSIIEGASMDYMTTSFVADSLYEICDKVENMAYEDVSDHVYEAKCFDGYAYANVYAHASSFEAALATADTSYLPPACKHAAGDKVVKYTFVFSCDCENIPDIPDQIIGGTAKRAPKCYGPTASSSGDPHIDTYDDRVWHCQGAGEFVLSKAKINNKPYDFELRGRFSKFNNHDYKVAWNSGVAVKQDVTVSIHIAEEAGPLSFMFADLPVNFYVDGVQRKLTDGSGDHRVLVTVVDRTIEVFFTNTGILTRVMVRPNSVKAHIRKIPGSLSIFNCLPSDNPNIVDVTGMFGTPDNNFLNDWMYADGTPMQPNEMSQYDYCTDVWCIKDSAASLFSFDAGYPFEYYNYCDIYEDKGGLDLTAAPDEIQDICAAVDMLESCLMDGIVGGKDAAEKTVAEILQLRADREAALLHPTDDAEACCSRDFKTCEAACATAEFANAYDCGSCDPDDTMIWLRQGPYDEGNLAECSPKDGNCIASHECCPGLECGGGSCKPTTQSQAAQADAVRRLASFVMRRPDLDAKRNTMPIAYSN